VLGQVLFLIFINDIVDIFGSDLTVKLFADDENIYAVIYNLFIYVFNNSRDMQ